MPRPRRFDVQHYEAAVRAGCDSLDGVVDWFEHNYGIRVTDGAVSRIKKESDIPLNQADVRRKVRELHWPFGRLPQGHSDANHCKRLSDHLTLVSGLPLSGDQRMKLRWFYNSLERHDQAVEYRPDNPPNDSSVHGGWRYVPRKDSDLIIRLNEYTDLADESRPYWTMPVDRP